MQTIFFTQVIKAPANTVWDVLWNDTTYPQWTAAFAPGSKAESDWKEGSKIIFSDGSGTGMLAHIKERKPPHRMVFQHKGVVKDGVEDTTRAATEGWAGALETYTLKEVDDGVLLQVSMQTTEQWKAHFDETWPKALQKIRVLAEGQR